MNAKTILAISFAAILGISLAVASFAPVAIASGANKSVYSTDQPIAIFEAGLEQTVASTTIKTAKPTDVLILFNEECALYTEVGLTSSKQRTSTIGVEIDTARAAHDIQLYVDGVAVGEKITMCDRTYGIHTNILNQIQDLCIAVDDIYDSIDGTSYTCADSFFNTWIKTNSAHGWNWIVVNLGQEFNTDGTHTIEVKGIYTDEDDTDNVENADEAVVIGERSLIVIPTQLDVGAT
ncbi:MAG TPA: hypothetical protein VJJ25_01040 [Nitrosopumilaceae archaeon]|nr:hypothetical protein [Nitrosopumilaceae archaeon]